MANNISSPKLLDVVKNEIEMKMKNDYTNVSKVIKKMDDKDMKKNTTYKLLEAYIRKELELQNINTILENLLKKKDLIDVYIPGFELDARKYIFKNPDPFGYKMMTETDNLMPVADFIWVMLSNKTFNQMKEEMKTSGGKLSDCLKYWQITGQLIEMFSKRDQIDLTFFFNFDKYRKEIKDVGKRKENNFPFKERTQSGDSGKKDDKKKDDKKKQNKKREIFRGTKLDVGGAYNTQRQDSRPQFNKSRMNTRLQFNKPKSDSRNSLKKSNNMSKSGASFSSGKFFTIFKDIDLISNVKRTTLYDELNTLIKNDVKAKLDTLKENNTLYQNMIVDYDKYTKIARPLTEPYLQENSKCSINNIIYLTQKIELYNDVYNINSKDKVDDSGITYDKELVTKYFYNYNYADHKHKVTTFTDALTRATHFATSGMATAGNISNKVSKIRGIQIRDLLLKTDTCTIGDILKPDFFTNPEDTREIEKKIDSILRRNFKEWMTNIFFNMYSINAQFELYRFESLNYIQTITRTQLKALLMRILNYLISYYSFFTKEYAKYQKTLIEDFNIDSKDVKDIVTRVKVSLPFVSKNKTVITEKQIPEIKIDNKFKNKQEAIDRITRLITKYKDEPTKLTELKELLKKARAL